MQVKSATFIKSSAGISTCPPPEKPEYAFVGRSNVGKSSIINMLVRRRKLAKTSSTPGKTQLINHFIINEQWYLVDLPGYGYAKVPLKEKKVFTQIISEYLLQRKNLVCLFVLVDVRHSPQNNDLEFMEWLGIKQIPFSIVFTKLDKLTERKLANNIKLYQNELLKTWESLPPLFSTSSVSGRGRDEILEFIDRTNRTVDI